MVEAVLGKELFSRIALFATSTLPWACRLITVGREVHIYGTKSSVVCAVHPHAAESEVVEFLDSLFCRYPKLEMNNFLALELMNPGSILHPTIFRGVVRSHWNPSGAWLRPPLFFAEVDDRTAGELTVLSAEYLALRSVIERRFGLNLESVIPIRDWLDRSYPGDIPDRTSFKTMLNSTRPYQLVPMPCVRRPDGACAPDYQNRYVAEEIPCGLMAVKGIAALVGIPTPQLDDMLEWGQAVLKKEYLVNGELKGRDLNETRAPQRFGINTIEEFMDVYLNR